MPERSTIEPGSPSLRAILPAGVAAVYSVTALVAGLRDLFGALVITLGAIVIVAARTRRAGSLAVSGFILAVLSLEVVVLVMGVLRVDSKESFTMLLVAAVAVYLAVLVWFALVSFAGHSARRAVLPACVAALALVGADRFIGYGGRPDQGLPPRNWPDSSDPHPLLGRVPRPSLTIRTFYSDDRDGYLPEPSQRDLSWALQLMPGSQAELTGISGLPGGMRVAIRRANRDTVWHIALTQTRYVVERGLPYFVTFRARADGPRKMVVEFSRSHPPWNSLGLYQEVSLTKKWEPFREVFVSQALDTNARLTFDLAGSDASVELDEVALHGPPAGRIIGPVFKPTDLFIQTKRNRLGCRDKDYGVPVPANTLRILALGNEFTAGTGLHEQDGVVRRLETALNASADSTDGQQVTYQVINCGIPGYGAHEQRIFFELFGTALAAHVVLVTTGFDDDRHDWEEQVRAAMSHKRGALERISLVARKIAASRRSTRIHGYRGAVEDLVTLDSAVRAQGALMVVAVNREGPPALADNLWTEVNEALARRGIPVFRMAEPAPGDSGDSTQGGPSELTSHRIAADGLQRWLQSVVLPLYRQNRTIP